MRAFRIEGWQQQPRLTEAPVPEPGPGQVRLRVAGCGLCHSDVAMSAMPAELGEALGWRAPFTLGHETAGWIDALGPGVAGSGWQEGDGVALASPASCGTCRFCRRGQENACPHGLVGRGYGRDGGLADLVLVDDVRSLLPLGELDPAVAGPLTDAGATSFHAVRRLLPRLRPEGAAVVLGVGGLGAYVVQFLRALTTCRVVAVDPNPVRRALALDLGAHDALDGVHEGSEAELRSLLGADGADGVVDLVGTDDTLAVATAVLGTGGGLALVGAAGGRLQRPWYGSLPRDGEVFTFQGSDLADARDALALAAQGRIRVDVDPYALDDVAAAYAALEAGTLSGRAVVRP